VRRALGGLAVLVLLAAAGTLAGVATAKPRAAKGATRTAMCKVGRPPGTDVRCRSASVSAVNRNWGRTIHVYRGGGAGTRKQRTSWLHRRNGRWRIRIAVVTPVGPTLPPCGKVPMSVLRDYYGPGACTR
jgi:hypothetical protein